MDLINPFKPFNNFEFAECEEFVKRFGEATGVLPTHSASALTVKSHSPEERMEGQHHFYLSIDYKTSITTWKFAVGCRTNTHILGCAQRFCGGMCATRSGKRLHQKESSNEVMWCVSHGAINYYHHDVTFVTNGFDLIQAFTRFLKHYKTLEAPKETHPWFMTNQSVQGDNPDADADLDGLPSFDDLEFVLSNKI